MSERLRRRKGATDREVQGTNDDAQISKLSCINAGYFKDPFLHFFVRTPSRRSPLINRGAPLRCYVLRRLIAAFLDRCPASAEGRLGQVLSLGAGFDSTWFSLKKDGVQPRRYIELDFQEVTRHKVGVVTATDALAALLADFPTEGGEALQQGKLITGSYSILPVDLRDLASVERALSDAEFDEKLPTLILAECVLVYLDPLDSTRLVQYFGQTLSRSVFLLYEQIRPDDAFGRQMLRNLEARGCPLRGLRATPSLTAHEERFKQNGWKRATARDMDTIYQTMIPQEEHRRISKLEIFDEFEEWHMIQEHYCICVAVNDVSGMFKGYGFEG